jgi:hypothetical protein
MEGEHYNCQANLILFSIDKTKSLLYMTLNPTLETLYKKMFTEQNTDNVHEQFPELRSHAVSPT